jgi:hypothetical protein
MVALEMIFIALATLEAACRNLASNSSLMMVADLARLACSHRRLVPYDCFYPVTHWVSFSPNLRPPKGVIYDGDGTCYGAGAVSDLGDGLVAKDFGSSELGSSGVLANDAILYLDESQEVLVGLSWVAPYRRRPYSIFCLIWRLKVVQ